MSSQVHVYLLISFFAILPFPYRGVFQNIVGKNVTSQNEHTSHFIPMFVFSVSDLYVDFLFPGVLRSPLMFL